MKQVHESDVLEELAFAKRAGEKFGADPQMYSYSDGDLKPGELLALRWGLGEDCVLVMKLHDYHEPTIYAQMAQRNAGVQASDGGQAK